VPRQRQSSAWSRHDAAVLVTVEIVAALVAGDRGRLRPVAADFPVHLSPDEALLAVGGVDVLSFRSAGDGTYAHQRPVVFTVGRPGTAAALTGAAVSAAGNRVRRRRAAADMQARWLLDDRGWIWVSSAGFYLRTPSGLFPWPWGAVRAVSLLEPGAVRLDGTGESSSVSWVLRTDWAELVLLLWTLARHPSHPQLQDGSWMPAGWLDRARAHGHVNGADSTVTSL
jgi:hypothetical protein